jgi:hypothetical protein
MPSLDYSKIKVEKKAVLAISVVAYSFLYIFTIAMLFLSWVAYLQKDFLQLLTYVISCSVFLVAFFLVVRDIYSNYDYFVQEGDSEGVSLLEGTHFLCADPMCPRCGGWYVGVALSLAIGSLFANQCKDIVVNYAYSGVILIVLGCVAFFLTTPVHASLNFLRRFDNKILGSKRLKLFCGFISGISLYLIALGVLVLMS